MQDDTTVPRAIRRSAELHQRTLAFARASTKRTPALGPEADTFESLALDIARFQYDYSPGFARLVAEAGLPLASLGALPTLPTDAFRYARVAAHPPELDVAVFTTSGTTGTPGCHPMRDLSTKEHLTLLQASAALFPDSPRGVVVALAPTPDVPARSSLGHMMELLIRHFDGRCLTPDPAGAAFDGFAGHRWLAGTSGVDVEGVHRAARIALHRSEPLTILSTSFALLALLEELDGTKVRTPSRTKVMITGGFKGKRARVDESELRERAALALHIKPEFIVGEYGMTELSSQLFEVPGTRLYLAPPWLKVQALDPVTRKACPPGVPGLAHFIDLGNVDSCLSVLTQDLIAVRDQGIELLGRAPRSTPRGCSLPYEGLLRGDFS